MKLCNTNLACLAVGISCILAFPVAASESVDLSSNIAIDSAISCKLTVTPVSTSVSLNYTVTQDNIDASEAGTYTLGGNGTADYVISSGSAACNMESLSIKMPVVGTPSGKFAVALRDGDTKFLVNTVLSDLYSTTSTDGSGTPHEIVGAGINRDSTTVQRKFIRDTNGFVQPLQPYKTTFTATGSTDTEIGTEAVFSAASNIRIDGAYTVDATVGWPSGYSGNVGPINGSLLPVGWLYGAKGGSLVNIPGASLTGQRSVTIKVGTAVSAVPYAGQKSSVGSVLNGEVYSDTGTLTVTSA